MRLVFLGTPDFAVPSLKALVEGGHLIAGVFTQPDRPAGRGKHCKPSPVKVAALELGLPVFQPEKIKAAETVAELQRLDPECIVVVAYGQILSREILDLPQWGCLNVHASLLPAYRGAAPIHWAILKGERVTGVTTMHMNEGLDTGDILLKTEHSISQNMTTGEVYDSLAEIGGRLLLKTLTGLIKGEVQPVPQSGPVSYAPPVRREHEQIDWRALTKDIHNQVRGLNPWPGAFTTFRGGDLKVWQTIPYHSESITSSGLRASEQGFLAAQAGEVVKVLDTGLWIGTGDGILEVIEVQPAGKRRMPARDFFLGRHAEVGERLGD
ncbi:MAG: methionyl-tRNA formyltransferase [Desulfitobacteriaceae bacterium]